MAPQTSCLHKIKFQLTFSFTITCIPSEMNDLFFRAKVFTEWKKNIFYIKKQGKKKTNKFD